MDCIWVVIKDVNGNNLVEGYIDDIFILMACFCFNWELFLACVVLVVYELLKIKDMDLYKFLVVGLVDIKFLIDNSSEKNWFCNCRVEIVIE